jgi:hypothetical protein
VSYANGRISVSISTVQLAELEETLKAIPNGARTAIRSAINDTLKYGRTALTDQMSDVLNLKKADIRQRINVAQRAVGNNLEGVLKLDYQAVPLQKFSNSISRRPPLASITTLKGKPPITYKHRFRQRMQSGHLGIFERAKGANKIRPTKGTYAGRIIKRGPNKGKPLLRQPIIEAFGISVVRAFDLDPALQDRALVNIADKFQERLASKVQWQLSKASSAEPAV